MAFLSPFGFDIFISYARVNNKPWPGTTTCWVTHFKDCLETAFMQEFGRAGIVTLWCDVEEIGGGMHFDAAIQEGVERSAVFLALTSNGYLAEGCYCPKELEAFHRKAQREPYGLRIGHRSRLLNVRLQDVPRAEWPEALEGREGFKFFDEATGRPLQPGPRFDEQFNKMFNELALTLRAFKPLVEQRRAEKRAEAAPAAANGSQTVFMAHAEGPLRSHRRRAVEELERNGVNVVTGLPPPRDLEGHGERVAAEIGRADLAVHLLEEEPGTEIDDAPEKFYSREQVEIGKRNAKSQLIWVPKTLSPPDVPDDAHRAFLTELDRAETETYKFVREAPTRIAPEVMARLELLKPARPAAPPPPPSHSVALLDIHRDDSRFVLDLSPVFIEQQVELRITPEGDGPRKNVSHFEDSLKQASVLIIIFGQVASDWVCERIVSVQQFFVKEDCPLKLCGVYIPPVDGANGERHFDCASRTGPLRVARIKSPEELRTLLRVFI